MGMLEYLFMYVMLIPDGVHELELGRWLHDYQVALTLDGINPYAGEPRIVGDEYPEVRVDGEMRSPSVEEGYALACSHTQQPIDLGQEGGVDAIYILEYDPISEGGCLHQLGVLPNEYVLLGEAVGEVV